MDFTSARIATAAQAHGMFDQMATYANPVDSNTVSERVLLGSMVPYYLNPDNIANLSPAPAYVHQLARL